MLVRWPDKYRCFRFEVGYGDKLQTLVDVSDLQQRTTHVGTVRETDAVGFELGSAYGNSHATIDLFLDMREKDPRAA